MARFWQDLTTTEFAALDPATTMALLPVAAIEGHGPHLPVGTDAFLNAGVLARALPALPDAVLVLPPAVFGKSAEHEAFAGTLSVSAATLIALWSELGAAVRRAGVRKLLFLNSHGGQASVIEIVTRELRVREGMFAVGAALSALGRIEGLFPPAESGHGIHGGASETAQMLALHPERVRRERITDFAPASLAWEREYEFLRPEGPGVRFGWKSADLHPAGAIGNAGLASAQAGERLVAARAAGLATNLELASLPPERLAALVRPCLPHLDLLVVNDAEIGALAGRTTVAEGTADVAACIAAAETVLDRGTMALVVVHFPAGAVALARDGALTRQPSVRVPPAAIAGANGAGDAFAAGFLYGRLSGWETRRALALGHAAAAASLRAMSTTGAVDRWPACLALAERWGWRDPV
ncbi:MAG: PfkB family carbohydrate kinase [Acetobacteraceae bacterium]